MQATGIGTVRSSVARGQTYANAVAAIPSLHSAVPMMVLLFSWSLVRARVRVLLLAYILAMTFTLTYGGEHYVVDGLIGRVYAAVAVYCVAGVMQRHQVSPDGHPVPLEHCQSQVKRCTSDV